MKDLKDVPEYAIKKIARPDKEFTEVIELGKWETSIQSYLAAIVSCIDVFTILASIGPVLLSYASSVCF